MAIFSGSSNTAIGRNSLFTNTASNNTAVGFEAGRSNTSGTGITAIGYGTLTSNTTGIDNVAVGSLGSYSATLTNNTTGSYNTAIRFKFTTKYNNGKFKQFFGLGDFKNKYNG
jgi:trimeric autotransporter adhesin